MLTLRKIEQVLHIDRFFMQDLQKAGSSLKAFSEYILIVISLHKMIQRIKTLT